MRRCMRARTSSLLTLQVHGSALVVLLTLLRPFEATFLKYYTPEATCEIVYMHTHLKCVMAHTGGPVQVRVRFDADEALGELARLNLLQTDAPAENGSAPGARMHRTVPPEQATRQLQEHWNNLLLRRLSTVSQEA